MKYILPVLCIALSACQSQNDIVDSVSYDVAQDLSRVEFAVEFSPKLKVKTTKEFPLKEYGKIYLQGYQEGLQKFTVGAIINPAALSDSDYIKFEKTDILPNGVPIGVSYPLSVITPAKPYDIGLFAYLDTERSNWIGMAIDFEAEIHDQIPNNLTLSMVFLRDKLGVPILFGKVFGNSSDSVSNKRAGVSLFANFKKLFEEGYLKAGTQARFQF